MKSYEEHQKEVVPESIAPLKSDIACTEEKCSGEMMISQPEVKHPQLPLKRAVCGECGWLGWV